MSEVEGKLDIFAALEGYYLISILDCFYKTGAMAALTKDRSIEDIASEQGFDAKTFEKLTNYVRQRMYGVFPIKGATSAGSDTSISTIDPLFLGHLLDQYIGAFGPCLESLHQILASPSIGAQKVNWQRHAQAFSKADRGITNSFMLNLLSQLNVTKLIDLGCGSGGLLLDFATQNTSIQAWGIDTNIAAIQMAQTVSQASNLDDRVKFYHGNALDISKHLEPNTLEEIQIITASNLANTFFGNESFESIHSWLYNLKSTFPNRLLLLSDYYGRLGTVEDRESLRFRRTLFHDVAQVLTGQGVPPKNIETWRKILKDADCTLVKAFESEHEEVAHFSYIIQL
ncbi:methyltransferase domain-containing protein [Pseudomonas sp. BNK-6]|uniref:methyltransferase domain-containing protein n=1 Tax=unclassified Pseudomonas TaxID=196821 RepID=UPI003A882A8A